MAAGQVIIPGLATAEWVEEKRLDWGEGPPLYQVRVRGDFPSQAENAIIALSLVEDALGRWEETATEGRLVLGVDCADLRTGRMLWRLPLALFTREGSRG